MNNKLLKTLSLVATIGGIAISLFADWVDDKELDEKINNIIESKLSNLGD